MIASTSLPTTVRETKPLVLGDRIEAELPCAACGYTLKGLRPGDACPECEAPIERALDPNRLCFALPEHLRGLEYGCALLSAATMALVLGLVGSLVFGPFAALLIVGGLLTLPVGLAIVNSTWTEALGISDGAVFRTVWLSILLLPLTLVICIASGATGIFALTLVSIPLPCACVAAIVIATLEWGRKAASRMPNRTLATQARMLQVLAAICLSLPTFTLMLVTYSLHWYLLDPQQPWILTGLIRGLSIASFASLPVFLLLATLHHWRLARGFRRTRMVAQQLVGR